MYIGMDVCCNLRMIMSGELGQILSCRRNEGSSVMICKICLMEGYESWI